MNLIGENVAKLRKKLKMSRQKLPDKLELYAVYVCRGSVSRIEDRAQGTQKGRKMRPYMPFGATGRTRTADLLITNQLLYRLSHSSIFC